MSQNRTDPDRFVGLDVHKHYLIAAAVGLPGHSTDIAPARPQARVTPRLQLTY